MSALAKQLDRPTATPDLFGYVLVTEVCGEFPGDTRRDQLWNARAYFAENELKRDAHRRVWVRGDAKLRSGQTVESCVHAGPISAAIEGVETAPDFGDWSPSQQEWYLKRHRVVREYEVAKRKYPNLRGRRLDGALAVDEVGVWAGEHGLSVTCSAIKRYKKQLKRGKPDSRGRSSNDSVTISPEAEQLFRNYYLDPREWSIAMCWEMVSVEAKNHGWSWPGLRTVQRWVCSELPAPIADQFRLGRKRWERKHAPRIHRSVDHIRPNEHWDGDHHQCDFLVTVRGKPVRPWLTAWRDFRSRKFVGYHLSPSPNSDTILAAFRKAVREHGAPYEITIDNGRDYRAAGVAGGKKYKPRVDEERVEGLMGSLGIIVHFTRAFEPQSKPIERAFGTVCERFSKTFQSYCGSSPDKRPETLYADMRAGRVEMHTLDDAQAWLCQWVEDYYHNKPHSGEGMNGRTPNEVFTQDDAIAKRTASDAVLDLLLMRSALVKVTKNGVRYNNVNYGAWNDELCLLHGKQVMLRIDAVDASYVHVCDLSGRLITTARNDQISGATHDEVREAAKLRARRAKTVAKARGETSAYYRDLPGEIIAVQAEHVQGRLRQAAGGEHDPPPVRNVELLPGAGQMKETARRIDRGHQLRTPILVFEEQPPDDSAFETLAMFALDKRDDEPADDPDRYAWMATDDDDPADPADDDSGACAAGRFAGVDVPLLSDPDADAEPEPEPFADVIVEERA